MSTSFTSTEPASAAVRTPIRPTKLAHFVLRTSQYKQVVNWYKVVFGAHAAFENELLSFLSFDEEHHRFAFLNEPNLAPQPDGVAGVHHIAFTYASLRDLMEHYARLRDLAIKPVFVINHGPTTSLYYVDPDGNQLEFQVENFDSVAESTQFFYSADFAENPIGVEFDPEEALRRLRAGEPEAELKRRPQAGPKGRDDIKLR